MALFFFNGLYLVLQIGYNKDEMEISLYPPKGANESDF